MCAVETGDGGRWLRADLSVSCDDDSYTVPVAVGWFAVCFYTLGTPALYAYIMFIRFRGAFLTQQNAEERCACNAM